MKKELLYVWIVAIGIALMATSCQKGKNEELLEEKNDGTLTVAVLPCKDCMPIYYAQQNGIFSNLGLKIKVLTYMAQLDIDTAIVNKHADVAYTDVIRLLMIEKKDSMKVQAVKSTKGDLKLICTQRRRVNRVSNLKELMVAVARHSITDYWSDRIMEENDMDRRMIFRPQINNLRIRTDMLCNGTMDAAFFPEPFASEALLRGNRLLMNTAERYVQQFTVFGVPESVLKKNNKVGQIDLLWKGYGLAVKELNTQPTDSLEALMKHLCQTPDSILQRVAAEMLPFDTLTTPQQRSEEVAIKWLRSRKQWEEAEGE